MKKTDIKVDYPIFKIVADGGLSSPDRGEGRFYPCLVIDIGSNVEILDLLKLHKKALPGDVELIWGTEKTYFTKPKKIFLSFEFIKPMAVSFGIEFEIQKHFALIDGIIQSRGVCLVSGKVGDKVSQLIDDSIIVEVPNLDFDTISNEMLFEALKDKYRKKGVPKKDITNYVKGHIKTMREVWNMRRPES